MHYEDRYSIKSRLVAELAREWERRGKTDIDLDQFDPVVNLLLEACSFEFERISNEISNSRNRMFDRFVKVLTPEAMTGPQVAHAIMHAIPNELEDFSNPFDHFTVKPEKHNKDLFFTPVGKFRLLNAKVNYFVYEDKIIPLNQQLERERPIETYGKYVEASTLYIGLQINDKIRSLQGLSFFLDWKNEPQLSNYLTLLSIAKWTINGSEISVSNGLFSSEGHQTNSQEETIFTVFNEQEQMKQAVYAYYEKHFYNISDDEVRPYEALRTYPKDFEQVFSQSDLDLFQNKLLWVKVQFPEDVELNNVQCLINCFPIINRKLVEKTITIKEKAYIFPLDIEDGTYYLSMNSFEDINNNSFMETPLRHWGTSDEGIYVVRQGGVQRFDSRDAKTMLSSLLNQLRDESRTFQALGYSHLMNDLTKLDRTLKKVQSNIDTVSDTPLSFIFFKPFDHSEVDYFVKYWITDGVIANLITKQPLKSYQNASFVPGSTILITPTKGGRAALDSTKTIQAFKETLMTRGRIVTAEDIKAFCVHRIGNRHIQSIKVSKGVQKAKGVKQGLIRTIEVQLLIKGMNSNNQLEWEKKGQDIAVMLNQKSSNINPIFVHIKPAQNV